MACATIHLAIAKRYLLKHTELDYEKVIAGTLYPDADGDDDKTHYTDKFRLSDCLSHVRGKVSLYAFLEDHEELDDFELGWFLHLVTDYLFFDECFSVDYLKSVSYDQFRDELYFAYDCLNNYLSSKYEIVDDDYKSYPGELYAGVPYQDCLLKKEMIDEFIDRVSSIDLSKYIDKINKNRCNIKP